MIRTSQNSSEYSKMERSNEESWVTEPREFDRFHDYLGLARLITKTHLDSYSRRTSVSDSFEDFSTVDKAAVDSDQDDSSIDSSESTGGFRPFTIDELSRVSRPVTTSRRWVVPKPSWCVFCKNNGEPEAVYTSHVLKDSLDKVACPRLRAYICPLCGTSGDDAHTIKYCPTNLGSLQPAPSKTSTGHLGMFISSRLLPTKERVSIWLTALQLNPIGSYQSQHNFQKETDVQLSASWSRISKIVGKIKNGQLIGWI